MRVSWLASALLQLFLYSTVAQEEGHRIAVIGGAISGSFVTKYLVDYDKDCLLDSITVYEPYPLTGPLDSTQEPNDDWQASRVQSLKLQDGTIVELGASIGFKEFHHVLDMIRADKNLMIGPAFNTGKNETTDTALRKGMGIYNGAGEWSLLTTPYKNSYVKKFLFFWRYGLDLIRITRITKQMIERFAQLPHLLASHAPGTFYESPDEVWSAINLVKSVHVSFDQLLDAIGVARDVSAWRRKLYQGSIRKELLTAINLVNYNQDASQVNGVVGLGSFAASSGGLFSIVGGNAKLIASAFNQASEQRRTNCDEKDSIQHVPKRVTTVVGQLDGLTLYSDEETLGTFDIVILATPMQQSRINFVVQSHFDAAVLQPMPMGALVNPEVHETCEGHATLPDGIPPSASWPYTQVVTTVVSNASLSADYFETLEKHLPRSILMTSEGKRDVFNSTAITQLSSSGVYKMFSNDKLNSTVLNLLFGPNHHVEYVKLWGGPHGGATPDYRGQGASPGFLLYDGAAGIEGHTKSGALYYPNAMEQSSLACMELSAIGAKAVAKLIAKRLGFVQVEEATEVRDEL